MPRYESPDALSFHTRHSLTSILTVTAAAVLINIELLGIIGCNLSNLARNFKIIIENCHREQRNNSIINHNLFTLFSTFSHKYPINLVH